MAADALALPDRAALDLGDAFRHVGERRLAILQLDLAGRSVAEIANEVGCPAADVRRHMSAPQYRSALRDVEANVRVRERFDVDHAHDMFMREYAEADDPAARLRAVENLVRLHGLDRDGGTGTVIDENGVLQVDYESMSEGELRRLAADPGVADAELS